MKLIFILSLLTAIYFNSYSQNQSYLEVNINKGVGLDWTPFYYTSLNSNDTQKLSYSAGGGSGIQLEYGKYFSQRLSLSVSAGYQQIFAFRYESMGGANNRSSASFNYKILSTGLNYTLYKSGKLIEEVSIGGNLMYSDASKLRIVENKKSIASEDFDSAFGVQAHANFILDIFSNSKIKGHAALACRGLAYENSEVNSLAEHQKLDGKGINLIFGVRKLF